MIEEYLKRLIDELKLQGPLVLDEERCYSLALDPTRSVQVKGLDPGIYFSMKIAKYPEERREELLMLLMKANLLGQGTGGAVIGLDRDENFLTLSSIFPYDMNFKNFKESLEDFVNFADYWKEEIRKHQEMARQIG